MVQQLAVHTVGGVVTPAQTLMVIVPSDSHLEIEAMVSNRDIGFVHAGDEVEIKIDTFDFTRYGLLHGQVKSISSDSIVRDVPTDKSTEKSASNTAATSEPKGQELSYAARISLDRAQMQVETRWSTSPAWRSPPDQDQLAPNHRLLLSPLMKYKEESLPGR